MRATRDIQSLTDITRAAGKMRLPATKTLEVSLMRQARHKAEQLAMNRKFHKLRQPIQRDKNGRFTFSGSGSTL